MTDEELARAKQLAQSDLRETVKFVAARYGIDPDELLRKLPQFPVNPKEPGQVAAFIAELQLKAEDWTITESEVMQAVYAIMIDIVRPRL